MYTVFMAKKNLIIRDGVLAIWRDGDKERPVVLCNVRKDENGLIFSARDRATNALIRRNGRPKQWIGDAVNLGTFVIENPEYEE
ncbi:MAG: hypothetical protein K2M95_04555, partial [Clostridiales bacterium]|nr:hypothetical protein [Clostridiales bacterium]